jgi:hypothetical protein
MVLRFKIIIIFCLFSVLQIVGQTKRYVATTGSDVTGTGTIINPYKTISKAATFLMAGDTLFVRGGTYTNANYNNGDRWKDEVTAKISGRDGSATQYIVVMPYPNEKVILKGDCQFIVQVQSSSYVKVEGFEIYGETENIVLGNPTTDDTGNPYEAYDYQFAYRLPTDPSGINDPYRLRLPNRHASDAPTLPDISNANIIRPYYYFTHGIVVQGSDHIDILNNLVHHVPGEGIRAAGSDYINIIGNEVHNCARRSSTGVHGISCYSLKSQGPNNNDYTIIIANNLVHDNYCELESWSEGKTKFEHVIDEGKGITLQRCFDDPSLSANNSLGKWSYHRVLIKNNVTYRNGFSGVHLNDGERVDILNNTSYLDCRTNRGQQLGISAQGSKDVRIHNNIVNTCTNISGGNSISLSGTVTSMEVKNNLINYTMDTDANGIDVGTVFNPNPQFTNPTNNDFSLQSTSPAKNQGLNTLAPTTDFLSMTRDNSTDIGAFEYLDLKLQIKVFLEGNFNAGLMTDNLRSNKILPNKQPFTGFPLVNNGAAYLFDAVLSRSGNNAIVDWIFVELRTNANPSVLAHTRTALLQADGDVVDIDGVSPLSFPSSVAGSYFVVIKHRSHLRVKTNNAITLITGVNTLNFTNGSIVGSTTPMKSIIIGSNTVYMMYAGDLNQDGTINATDRSNAWNARNITGYNSNDCSMNGTVDATDRSNTWNNRNISSGF